MPALTAPGRIPGLALVVTGAQGDRIDLIEVSGPPVSTLSGIHAGSTEAAVLAAYPGQVEARHPASPRHWLVFHPRDPRLADRSVVFVTDGSKVRSMAAGVRAQAEPEEPCA